MPFQIVSGTGAISSPGVYSNGTSANGAAPDTWWDALEQALIASGAGHVLRIILNRLGHASSDTPSAVATFVQSGGVYIDWCDWPWYGGGGFQLGQTEGFYTFNQQGLGGRLIPLHANNPGGFLGIGGGALPFPFDWTTEPWSGLVDPSTYPYNRGLITFTADQTRGIVSQAPWVEVNYASGGFLNHIYVYSTLRVPSGSGNGSYFYAAVSPDFLGNATTNAVPADVYSAFILGQLGFSVPSGSSGITPSASHASTGAPAPGLPTMASCQGQVFSLNDEGQSLACVKTIQARLDTLIGARLAVDGYYGPLTTAAVKTFQSRQGIAVDGITGPETWGKLENPSSGPAQAATATSAEQQQAAGTTVGPTTGSGASSLPPASSHLILGLPAGEVEIGGAVIAAGLLALLLLNRG